MKNVLVDMEIHPKMLQQLQEIPGLSVRFVYPEKKPRLLPLDLIKDIHILFCTFPPNNFSKMATLEFIQLSSSGYAQLHNLPLVSRGIRACNGRGIFDTAIAEWNVAMMVNLVRDLRGMIRNQETGTWDRAAVFQREIRGSIVGIWGYGAIGRETARLAKTMGLTVYVMSRNGVGPTDCVYAQPGTGDPTGTLPDRVYVSGQEIQFLEGLDFLILSMPLTKSTTGIIGERELQALPHTAFVLNPARGLLIKETALLTALQNAWIAGAALDTHYYYPMPADHPLWRFSNVIVTPHISGSDKSTHYLERSWGVLVENVKRLIKGKPLLNELTHRQLEGD